MASESSQLNPAGQQNKDPLTSNDHLPETTRPQPRKKRRTEATPATGDQVASPRRTTRRKLSSLQTQPTSNNATTSADSHGHAAISHEAPIDPQLKPGEGQVPAVGGLPIQKGTGSAGHNGNVRSCTTQGQAMLTGKFDHRTPVSSEKLMVVQKPTPTLLR